MAKKTPTIEFPQWAPDISSLGTGVSGVVTGVVPRADGYGPFKNLQEFTAALPTPTRGYFFARRSDGSIAVFAGTETRLYLLNNITFAWIDVSKGGAAYSPLVSTSNWQFRQFNDVVVAVQINTAPQEYTLSTSAAFADLAGSPPAAAYVAVINRFLVLSGLLSNPRRVQWSDLDNIIVWTAGVGLSDFQDLPDGGIVHGMSGSDAYGIVFQDESIRSFTYSPGSAVTFQIVRISTQDTLFAEYSIINAGEKTFFCSAQGFKRIDPGGTPVNIGKERVDRYFFDNVDRGNLQLVIGAPDPTATRVYWAFKSIAGAAGLFDKLLCYDWSIGKDGRWSLIEQSGEFISALAKPGLTLEQLDAIAPTPLAVTGTGPGAAGVVRLTMPALSNANFAIAGQNFIAVYGVVGTTEANGTWRFSIVDATHVDLIGTVYANAWVSGGQVGGSLDALPFSLDSVSKAAVAELSAMTSDHKLAFFAGDNMEAVVETEEQDGEGEMIFIGGGILAMSDCADAMISVGWRMSPQAAAAYTAESALNAQGKAHCRIEARYLRGRFRAPEGAEWTYARGLQPDAQGAGER